MLLALDGSWPAAAGPGISWFINVYSNLSRAPSLQYSQRALTCVSGSATYSHLVQESLWRTASHAVRAVGVETYTTVRAIAKTGIFNTSDRSFALDNLDISGQIYTFLICMICMI